MDWSMFTRFRYCKIYLVLQVKVLTEVLFHLIISVFL